MQYRACKIKWVSLNGHCQREGGSLRESEGGREEVWGRESEGGREQISYVREICNLAGLYCDICNLAGLYVEFACWNLITRYLLACNVVRWDRLSGYIEA